MSTIRSCRDACDFFIRFIPPTVDRRRGEDAFLSILEKNKGALLVHLFAFLLRCVTLLSLSFYAIELHFNAVVCPLLVRRERGVYIMYIHVYVTCLVIREFQLFLCSQLSVPACVSVCDI